MDKYNSIEEKFKTMNIKDYLHLYLGCEIKALIGWRNYSVGKVYKLNTAILNDFEVNNRGGQIIFKPILRPLSDMTEVEWKAITEINKRRNEDFGFSDCAEKNIYIKRATSFYASEFHFLLSKHFDLFGLIEAGLAIDKTKLNSDNNEVKSKNNEQ